ncbi:MAG: hypothetical protein JWM87_256 [Candidatus Eremiobacteraeota bacterium]|nr:hypothetical protein [Candidatus Eremiobacteraeota bacterium]
MGNEDAGRDCAVAAAGDPVCWLHLVCDSCGALIEREGDRHRPGCETISEPDP